MHDHRHPSVRVDLEEVQLSSVARADVELDALTGCAKLCQNGFGNA
nr:hypothetical protein [Leptolyngbya sp. Cla-17]